MEHYEVTKDFMYHDVLVAGKGDIVTVDGELVLTNEERKTAVNDKALIQSMIRSGWLTKPNDPVNHPKHYTSHPSGVECIEITRHYCFAIGNAIKYLWRAGLKIDAGLTDKQKEIEDLEKAIWYIKDRIKQLKNEL